ncbi:MAG: hypothetical protein ACOH2J_07785 [Allorhizobium sp.]
MQTALIMMTILGCDDSVNQCHYIATDEKRWVSVELCDADSEKVLGSYNNVSYPTVVAVCQLPDSIAPNTVAVIPAQRPADGPPAPAGQTTADPMPEHTRQTLAARAVSQIRKALPGTSDIRMVFETPIHVIADSYAWVAKKVAP